MPALNTYQYRKFGAGSTVVLAKFGGAVLGGVWISTKGTAGKITVYDNSASLLARVAIPSSSVGAVGNFMTKDVEFGTGLCVVAASCTGTIFWRPGAAGGV